MAQGARLMVLGLELPFEAVWCSESGLRFRVDGLGFEGYRPFPYVCSHLPDVGGCLRPPLAAAVIAAAACRCRKERLMTFVTDTLHAHSCGGFRR